MSRSNATSRKSRKGQNIKKQVGNRKAGSRINDGQRLIPHPPPIQSYNILHTAKIRFILNAAFANVITWQNLLDTILVATSATALVDLFFAVKIKYIEVWSLPVIGGANSVSVTFDGTNAGFVGNQVTHTDTSMGIEPAHLRVSPGRKTLASMFQVSSTQTAFLLNVPNGAVVDLKLIFKSNTVANAVTAQNVGAALGVGGIYWRGLDGVAAAATKFTPPLGIAQA
jgi:hypothetical protein